MAKTKRPSKLVTKAKPFPSSKTATTKRKPHYDKDGKGKPTF